jgi:threonine synthase
MDDEWTKKQAGQEVENWLKQWKANGGFGVHADILNSAKKDFESERVSDAQTIETVKQFYATPASNGTNGSATKGGYILDPHSAIGVAASLR